MFHFVITFPPFVDVGARRRRLRRGHGHPLVDLLGCGGQCFAPPLDLDETRIGRHAACPRALRPAGGEKVDATTAVGRLARQTERLVVRRRLVGVGYPLAQSVRDLGSADDLPAIVEQANEIAVLDGALLGVGRADADDEIIMPVDQPTVFGDVVDRRVLAIAQRVEAVADMRGQELDGVTPQQLAGRRAFPAWNVAVERRAFRVAELLQALRDEFDLPALRLQPLQPLLGVIAGQGERLGDVLLPSFVIPTVRGRRAQRFGFGRDDVVALPQELLPADVFRDVGPVEEALAPVELGGPLSEDGAQSQSNGQVTENLEIRF